MEYVIEIRPSDKEIQLPKAILQRASRYAKNIPLLAFNQKKWKLIVLKHQYFPYWERI